MDRADLLDELLKHFEWDKGTPGNQKLMIDLKKEYNDWKSTPEQIICKYFEIEKPEIVLGPEFVYDIRNMDKKLPVDVKINNSILAKRPPLCQYYIKSTRIGSNTDKVIYLKFDNKRNLISFHTVDKAVKASQLQYDGDKFVLHLKEEVQGGLGTASILPSKPIVVDILSYQGKKKVIPEQEN